MWYTTDHVGNTEEFAIYLNYVRKLGFEETPDYDFLRELLSQVLANNKEPEDGVYDWMLLNNGKGWEAGSVSFRFRFLTIGAIRFTMTDFRCSRFRLRTICWHQQINTTVHTARAVFHENNANESEQSDMPSVHLHKLLRPLRERLNLESRLRHLRCSTTYAARAGDNQRWHQAPMSLLLMAVQLANHCLNRSDNPQARLKSVLRVFTLMPLHHLHMAAATVMQQAETRRTILEMERTIPQRIF